MERACIISLNAYHRLSSKSFFGKRLEQEDIKEAKKSIVFLGFCKLVRLAKKRGDYFVILKLIEEDVEGTCCMLMFDGYKEFSGRFIEARKNADPEMVEKFEKYYREEEKKIR